MNRPVQVIFSSTEGGQVPACLADDESLAVSLCTPGLRAIEQIERSPPDVVVLDADKDFFGQLQFFYSLRSLGGRWPIPVAALVDESHKDIILTALDAGIDECVHTALDPWEVAARLRALARRSKMVASSEKIHFADLVLDPISFKVWRGSRLIPVTTLQFRLLQFLVAQPGRVFTRRELLNRVWNDESLDEGAVTACIVRLRRALIAGGESELIRSARGVGYALDDDAILQH